MSTTIANLHSTMEAFKMKFAARLDNITDSDYRGIRNPGALCYLNSVLHVLHMTHQFPEAVESKSATRSVFLDPYLERLFSVLEKRTADTDDIARALGITEAEIYEQRDAAEYFQKILSGVSPEASQMFQGKLKHGIRCSACGTSNKTEALFWTLPLSVQPSLHRHSPCDLETAFQNLFTPSTVTGDDRIYCDTCKAKRDATIVCSLKHPPQILSLQLERFQFDYQQKCFGKITCHVDVPQKLYTKGCSYDLYAHVNHYGSLRGGHYTARIKSHKTGAWYSFDDARVRLVNPQPFEQGESSAKSSSAYLLMYRKGSVAVQGEGPSFTTAAGSVAPRGGRTEPHSDGLWI